MLGFLIAFWSFPVMTQGRLLFAIVIVFHVRDPMPLQENRYGRVYHAVRFLAVSLLLGYALFRALPNAYLLVGFGPMERVILVTAAIIVHHFIVDVFIWRFNRGGANLRIVAGAAPAIA